MDAKTLQQMLQSVGLPPWAGIRDIERPGWANQVIETAWPYLDKATSDAIILSVDPILQDYCPPFLTSIRFDKFTFGSGTACVRLIFSPLLPYFPCFGAISVSLASRPNLDFDLRVVGSDITLVPGDEGKVEADIFVVWAGDPEVVLGVRTAGDS
eukprot:gene20251-24251_t